MHEKRLIKNVWYGMKRRCSGKDDNSYARRGIKVCEEWLGSFESFHKWALNNGWRHGLHIDRIDNDKGYSPDNCRFITQKENNAVGRRCVHIDSETGIIGVGRNPNTGSGVKKKWRAHIVIPGGKRLFKYAPTIEECIKIRYELELEHYGEALNNLEQLAELNLI